MNLQRNNYDIEYDSEGNLIEKQLIIKLMLNRSSEKMTPNFSTVTHTPNIIIRGLSNESSIGQPTQLDLEDVILYITQHLQLCVSQPIRPQKSTLHRFIKAHQELQIDDDTRKAFVMLFTEAYLQKLSNPNYYEVIVQQIAHYPHNYFSSIEKDANRTFNQDSGMHSQLLNVLCAYAIRNPRLLYCQGLNYIVAYFLMNGYSESEAFWVLTQLVQEILPLDYYVDMGSIISLRQVLDDLMAELMVKFTKTCQNINLQTSFFLVPWLVCLYTKGFCSSLTKFIIECIVIDREVTLIKAALTLLKLVQQKVEECEDFSEMMKQIQLIVVSVSVKQFKQIYDSIYINGYFFKVLYDNYLRDYDRKVQHKSIDSINKQKNVLPLCSKQFPVCLHVIEIERRFRIISQVDTFKIKASLDSLIHQNYLDKAHLMEGTAKGPKNHQLFKKNIDELLIGRHEHICEKPTSRKNVSELSDEDLKNVLKVLTEQFLEIPSETEKKLQGEIQMLEFSQKTLRHTNTQKLDSISSIFEIVEDFQTEQIDMVQLVVEEKKQTQKQEQPLRLPSGSKTNAIFNWIKKVF